MITAAAVPKRAKRQSIPQIESDPVSTETSDTNPLNELDCPASIESIPLASIKLHANNRDLANDETIPELAESIERLGQLEPATLRRITDRKFQYEMLSGERRYRALRKLGRTHINAMVVDEQSPDALVRLAACNSNRQDLNAVDRAIMMEHLMQPVAKGGSGLSRIDAGRAVGLTSDSGCKNALRILKLPQSIQTLIRSGKLSERAARRLVPFAELTAAMDAVAKDLELGDNSELLYELTTSESIWAIKDLIESNTRPMDDRQHSLNVDKHWSSNKKLFDGDAGLTVHEIEIDKTTWRLTTQCKEWDDLQVPLVREQRANRTGSTSGKQSAKAKALANSSASTTAVKQTPAQLAKEQAAKRKAADERLAKWTKETFVPCALRCQLADSIPVDYRLLMPFVKKVYYGSYSEILDAAYLEAGITVDKISTDSGRLHIPVPGSNEEALSRLLWRLLMWPVSGRVETKGHKDKTARRPVVVSVDCVPDLDRVVNDIHRQIVSVLASRCDLTMQHFWFSARDSSPQRELLAVWIGRHTTEQLKDLWQELKIKSSLEQPARQSELAEVILSQHTITNKLPAPRRLG